ncbi:hypothetical protein D3C75_751970 [compost metagenome]
MFVGALLQGAEVCARAGGNDCWACIVADIIFLCSPEEHVLCTIRASGRVVRDGNVPQSDSLWLVAVRRGSVHSELSLFQRAGGLSGCAEHSKNAGGQHIVTGYAALCTS